MSNGTLSIASLETKSQRKSRYQVMVDEELQQDDLAFARQIIAEMAADSTIDDLDVKTLTPKMAAKLNGVTARDLNAFLKKVRHELGNDDTNSQQQLEFQASLTYSQSQIAEAIADRCDNEIAVDPVTDTFMRYNGSGVWEVVGKIKQPMVFNLVDEKIKEFCASNPGYGSGYGASTPDGVARFLAGKLWRDKWNSDPDLVPFANGVYSLSTGKLGPHDPNYFFTWQLGFDYDPDATCPTIDKFLSEATADLKKRPVPGKVMILLAFMRLMLSGDLNRYQKILYMAGPPRAGKGTVMGIFKDLVGVGNYMGTTLRGLENDKHEATNFKDMRAIIIDEADYDKVAGSLPMLKLLSSGEDMPFKLKHINSLARDAMIRHKGIMACAGNSVLNTDDVGLLRRLIVLYFHHVSETQKDLKPILRPELPGLINKVLKISEQQAMDILTDAANDKSDEIKQDEMESLLSGNILARWAHDKLAYVEPPKGYPDNDWNRTEYGDGVQVGVKKLMSADDRSVTYEFYDTHLLPSFLQWAHESNESEFEIKRYNVQNFSRKLVTLLRDVRGLKGVCFDRVRGRSKIFGVRITENGDSISPIAYSFGLVDNENNQADNVNRVLSCYVE
jgi:hypothetical protein